MSLGRTFPGYEPPLAAGVWQPKFTGHDDAEEELAGLWSQLGGSEQCNLCMRALRVRPGLQWRPGGESYLFGDFTIQQRAGLIQRVGADRMMAASRQPPPLPGQRPGAARFPG